jgi:hypothetical protein
VDALCKCLPGLDFIPQNCGFFTYFLCGLWVIPKIRLGDLLI